MMFLLRSTLKTHTSKDVTVLTYTDSHSFICQTRQAVTNKSTDHLSPSLSKSLWANSQFLLLSICFCVCEFLSVCLCSCAGVLDGKREKWCDMMICWRGIKIDDHNYAQAKLHFKSSSSWSICWSAHTDTHQELTQRFIHLNTHTHITHLRYAYCKSSGRRDRLVMASHYFISVHAKFTDRHEMVILPLPHYSILLFIPFSLFVPP